MIIVLFMKLRHSVFPSRLFVNHVFAAVFHLFGSEYRYFIASVHMNLWEEFLSKAASDNVKKEANLVLLGRMYLLFAM